MTASDLASIEPGALEARVRALGLSVGRPVRGSPRDHVDQHRRHAAASGRAARDLFRRRPADATDAVAWAEPGIRPLIRTCTLSIVLRPTSRSIDSRPSRSCSASRWPTRWPPLALRRRRVKWPNDVSSFSRKLAGILVEGSVIRGSVRVHRHPGLGLNVQTRFDPSIASRDVLGVRSRRHRRAPTSCCLCSNTWRRTCVVRARGSRGLMHDIDARDVHGAAVCASGTGRGRRRHRARRSLAGGFRRGVVLVHAGDVEMLERTAVVLLVLFRLAGSLPSQGPWAVRTCRVPRDRA